MDYDRRSSVLLHVPTYVSNVSVGISQRKLKVVIVCCTVIYVTLPVLNTRQIRFIKDKTLAEVTDINGFMNTASFVFI